MENYSRFMPQKKIILRRVNLFLGSLINWLILLSEKMPRPENAYSAKQLVWKTQSMLKKSNN